ncbi:MAG: hypothetical protein WC156_11650 [Pedobacter sp.]
MPQRRLDPAAQKQIDNNAWIYLVCAIVVNFQVVNAIRSITASPGNYIRISSNIESGIAPLNISLRLDGSFSIANPQINFSGPVPITLRAGASPTDFTTALTVEGTYTFTASAVGPDGQMYSDTVLITVVSLTKLENLLKGKWEGMKTAIINGNIDTALSYMVATVQDRYRTILTAPSYEAAARFSEISRIEIFTVNGRAVQAGAIRLEDSVEYAYPLNIVQDVDGIWKIVGY